MFLECVQVECQGLKLEQLTWNNSQIVRSSNLSGRITVGSRVRHLVQPNDLT